MNKQSNEYLFISSIVAEEFIDINMTELIKSHIKKKNQTPLKIDDYNNGQMASFETLCNLYNEFRCCDKVESAAMLNDSENAVTVLKKFNLIADSNVMCCTANYNLFSAKNIKFIVLSNTILLFLQFRQRVIFLCALSPAAFQLEFIGTQSVDVKVVVNEKSKAPLFYYEQYNPCPDSKILSMNWEKTNLDGSRSFAGGLKPENNPLCFTLEYGLVNFRICGFHFETRVSNAKIARQLVDCWQNFYITSNNEFFDKNKSLKIRKKCINKYFSLSTTRKYRRVVIAVASVVATVVVFVSSFLVAPIVGKINRTRNFDTSGGSQVLKFIKSSSAYISLLGKESSSWDMLLDGGTTSIRCTIEYSEDGYRSSENLTNFFVDMYRPRKYSYKAYSSYYEVENGKRICVEGIILFNWEDLSVIENACLYSEIKDDNGNVSCYYNGVSALDDCPDVKYNKTSFDTFLYKGEYSQIDNYIETGWMSCQLTLNFLNILSNQIFNSNLW